ncbi:lamin tail domain-containing protein [Corallococcus macrosporus]|uniref:Lamin tail domain-containing protein n=2 Tax=Corallococcus macrosporus TaxID=35 RepID=A0ABS3DDD5_9BACT|nr:lamin tail domain-containing protein [Corallococcus macrosporus]MBN8229679.1 lamin tail domain-containing protein [Corallococcus macrosporus]
MGACGLSAWEEEPQACAALLPGDVVITEYLNDPTGADTGREYVELHNPTRGTVDLLGVTLFTARDEAAQERVYTFTTGLPVDAGAFVVLGDVREGALPEHVDQTYGDALGALGNSAGLLGLRCGTRVLDTVVLGAPAKSGVARTYDGRLVPDAEGNDDPSRWCDAPDATRGSPGSANAPCPALADGGVPSGVTTCLPPGAVSPREVQPPRPGELIITEVMANPRGDDTVGEWLEVRATAPVDLNGLTVGTDTQGTRLESERCLSLAAGESALLARRKEPEVNGGLPEPLATFSVDLRNAGGGVAVRAGGVLIDSALYGPAQDGVAIQVSAPLTADAKGNDVAASWCAATEPYGDKGNLGTPGRGNRTCTGTDAGAAQAGCIDRTTGQPRALRAPSVGSLVITEFMADPVAVPDALGEWVEVLALREVDLNGVTLANEAGSAVLESPLCLSLKAGGFAVLARGEDASLNGGLPAVLGTFGFGLGNGAGAHVLKLSAQGAVLDAVAFTNAASPGVSSQLDARVRDATRNDAAGAFCLTPAGVTYGVGDLGTPGRENRTCAP